MSAQKEQTFSLFKCLIPSCKFYFKNGSVAYFTDGRFATCNETEIAELNEEVKMKHPHIYIDDEEPTAKAAFMTPMDALREKFFKEFQEAAANTEVRDTGNTDASSGAGAGLANSVSIQAKVAAAQSQSAPVTIKQ